MRPIAFLALLGSPSVADAQEDVEAASNAFAEGQRAQLRHDYARAAELFEIADQAAPSAAALRSAIRSHQAADHDGRAATLALRALERYPDDRSTRRFAARVVARLGRRLTKLEISCTVPCTLKLDGGVVGTQAMARTEEFVDPGSHTVEASWPDRDTERRTVEGRAGRTETVAIEAPAEREPEPLALPAPEASPEPAVPRIDDQASTPSPDTRPAPAPSGGGFSPAVFWIGTGLSVVAGGALVWSGLDTLSARDEYVARPTKARYEDGTDLELRTNILVAATTILGVMTIAIGLFATDWGGEQNVSVALSSDRLVVSLGGVL